MSTTVREKPTFVAGADFGADTNFKGFKAIALSCDNGAVVPTSPAPTIGQWFLHAPTGRKVLLQYDGSVWRPMFSLGAITVYVDKTDGTDAVDKGGAVDAGAYKTIQYAIDSIPPLCSGVVTINLNGETYVENPIVQGKYFTGNYWLLLTGTPSNVLAQLTASVALCANRSSTTALATIGTTGQAWTIGTSVDSGTNTSVTANKLVDSGQNFLTTVRVGMVVKNTTDSTWARVTAVDSNTTLSLDTDIFTAGSKAYDIGRGQYSGKYVRITGGTGVGQRMLIESNTNEKLYLIGTWTQALQLTGAAVADIGATPSGTSTYVIEDNTATSIVPTSGHGIRVMNGQQSVVVSSLSVTAGASTTGSIYTERGTSLEVYCVVSSGGRGIYAVGSSFIEIRNCYMTSSASIATAYLTSYQANLKNCWFFNSGAGFSGSRWVFSNGVVQGCRFESAGNEGLLLQQGSSAVVSTNGVNGNWFLNNGTYGIVASSGGYAQNASSSNNQYDNNTSGTRSPAAGAEVGYTA